MPDEPSGYELQRSIDALRADWRDGIAAINGRLDRLVSTEAHAADLRRVDERMAELAKDLADERQARVADIAQERQARKQEMADMRQALDKMTNLVRWAIAAIAVPVSLFVGNIVFAARGGG